MQRVALVTIGVGVGWDRGGRPTGGRGQWWERPDRSPPRHRVGPLCERGHRGCVRSYLSSTSIVSQVSTALGHDVRYDEVLGLAAAGNPVARRVVEEAGRALGTLIGTIAAITAPIKVLLSGEGVALASAVLDTAGEYARSVQHWTLPDVPIEIAPFTFTEWAKGAAVIALRNQLDSALRPDA